MLAGLWNGILVAVLKIQPFVATLILMVAGRGVAQLITSGQIVTFNSPNLAWIGSGNFLFFPTPVIVALVTLVVFWLFTRKTALGMFIEAVGINIRAAKKRRGKYAADGDADLRAERRLCCDCRGDRGRRYSRS
ncbi:Putative sugar ABC transport system, permease protein YtfT [Enterobacter hormaechei]|nr:Putative sugar ABC transport system, permease protein YtfT [Enterobacter hormaechei]